MTRGSQTAVIVTGAAGGLGSAVAEEFSHKGHYVVGVDTNAAAAAHTSITADVSRGEEWDRIVQETQSLGHQVSALINCAGIGTRTDILTTSEDEWSRVTGVNLTGTWLGMKTCYPLLAEQPHSAIVNVGSIYGQLPPPRPPNPPSSPAYQASKAGVVALTRTAASEFAEAGVRVNCVIPGLFHTGLTSQLTDEEYALRMSPVAMGRDGAPSEFASTVYFLASEAAAYVTGSTLNVDGGYPLCL